MKRQLNNHDEQIRIVEIELAIQAEIQRECGHNARADRLLAVLGRGLSLDALKSLLKVAKGLD